MKSLEKIINGSVIEPQDVKLLENKGINNDGGSAFSLPPVCPFQNKCNHFKQFQQSLQSLQTEEDSSYSAVIVESKGKGVESA